MKKFLLILALIIEAMVLLFFLTIGLYLYILLIVIAFDHEPTIMNNKLITDCTRATLLYALILYTNIMALIATIRILKDKPLPYIHRNIKIIIGMSIIFIFLH